MTQLPENDRSSSEASGYMINPENTAEMARLTRLAEHLIGETGLLPRAIDLTSRTEFLDIGCGPGGWVMEIARCFPASRVIGLDISALMIAYAQFCAQAEGRSNVQFLRADARQRLPFADETFDVVHASLATAWLSKTTWPAVIQDYVRLVKPGGIVCCVETENLGITTSAALANFNTLCLQAMRRANQCFTSTGDYNGITTVLPFILQEAGLQDVQLEAHAVQYSFGTSGYGAMVENFTSVLKLLQPFLLDHGAATQVELDVLYDKAMEDMQKEDFRAIIYYVYIWGKK